MNMLILCVLMALYINITIVICFIGYQLNKAMKLKRSLEEKKILLSIEVKDENFEILDKLITDNITQYCVLKFGFEEQLYIKEKEQQNMVNTVLKNVLEQISPIYYEKLIIIYNKDRLEDIIYQKVSMAVFSYVASVNGHMVDN